jgi:hypothetical protein
MPTSAPGSLSLIVSALRPETDSAVWSQQAQSTDAEKLAVSAIALGVAPLLVHRLNRWSLSLPTRAQTKLLAVRRDSATRQQSIMLQLTNILDAAQKTAIDVLVLKGAYLATHVYPEPGLRPMNDIDILVRPNQLAAMEDVLRGLGYAGHYKDPARGARVTKHTSSFRRTEKEGSETPNPYLSIAGDRTVEPHVSLEESWYGLRADITPGIWDRSVKAEFDRRAARALCASDLLLHLCIHFSFHLIMGYPSLVQLVDLMVLSPRLSEEDWQAVVDRAIARHAQGFIYAALRLAWSGVGAPVPEKALALLWASTPANLRDYADGLTVEAVTQRAQRSPLTTMRKRLARGVAERAEASRWATSWQERIAVWRTLLDVSRTDTGRMIAARVLARR